ncbi:hypothetical protein B0T10DRAFT_71755 [Thelonectria olida]|uniref:Glucose-methanol-choline oxidoreductase N-terminal domain-containing protein n=1 Tax=Thelonectria olida TaxID=1576542 RepID=A0A9P9AP09_9HYPO|nr:hypothetical protein B0T10DRAFT_71755 [Thelonectria olida]
MKLTSLLGSALALPGLALAASTTYVDPDTKISFQRWTDTTTSFSFGIALPSSPSTDFIGQISAPITEGYAAVALRTSMASSLLIVAWPNGDSVVSSLRQATGYSNPDVLDDSTVTLKVIEDGTSVNSTAFTYTFLCEGCIKTDDTTFAASDTSAALGWALSKTALDDASDASGALNYHAAGFGGFGVTLTDAQSSDYATWAAMATEDTSGTTPGAGSGSGSSGNITTTISNVTYDYIVAGAGAAGLIVAERLAESGSSVLLLERGKASYYSTGGQSVMDWNSTITQYDVPSMGYYLSTADDTSEYCTDTASQAGCILGGSTAINAMMWVKPRSEDFDRMWPTGWKWADGVETAAERLYKRTPGTTTPSKDGKLYDQGAWDVLEQFLGDNGFSEVDAVAEPAKKRAVYSHPPTMIHNGLRAGPVRDYLPLAQALPKFDLKLNSKMVRAVRNGSSITGVEVETSASTRQIINLKANGAVVLASGALSTPRILFNSGIGPTAQISTVSNGTTHVTLPAAADWINLPVGEHLMDHPIFTVNLQTKKTLTSLASTDFTEPSQTNIDMFAQGSGILAQSGQRLVFWTSVKNTTDGVERFVQGTCNSPSNDTVRIKVYLTHGLSSTGTLGITSAGATKITKEPYLQTAADKEAILSFMNQLISYASKSDSVLSIASNTTAESLIADYVTGSHFVGTAKMGTANDGTSVVDTNTKVWGTDNLFVVDASIHPDLPTGNTQSIVMVAAEHAATKILARTSSGNSTTETGSSGSGSGTGSSRCKTKRGVRRSRMYY